MFTPGYQQFAVGEGELNSHFHAFTLSENAVASFIRKPRAVFPWRPVVAVGAIAALMLSGYAFLNYQALSRMYASDRTVVPTALVNENGAPILDLTDQNAPEETGRALAGIAPETETAAAPTIPNNSISVEGLNIAAPIHWDSSLDEKTIQNNLLSGVAHFAGTAKPGETGFATITGHSSNYPWVKGAFNTIFAPLHKAAPGQKITVNYENKEYVYEITRIFQIKPTDVQILQEQNGSGLRLITCTPLGTSLRRLVVEATQVSPHPMHNVDSGSGFTATELPATR